MRLNTEKLFDRTADSLQRGDRATFKRLWDLADRSENADEAFQTINDTIGLFGKRMHRIDGMSVEAMQWVERLICFVRV